MVVRSLYRATFDNGIENWQILRNHLSQSQARDINLGPTGSLLWVVNNDTYSDTTRRCIQYLQSNSIMDITPSKCATQLPRRRLLARDAESFIEGTGEVGELSSAFSFPTTAARLNVTPHRVLHTYNRIYFIRHNRITYCRSQFTFLLLWYGVRYGRVTVPPFFTLFSIICCLAQNEFAFKHSYLELHASLGRSRQKLIRK